LLPVSVADEVMAGAPIATSAPRAGWRWRNVTSGEREIMDAVKPGGTIGGTKATQGMAAACIQFGYWICFNDLTALKVGKRAGKNPVRASYKRKESEWT
jgi:hypothetical protein